MNRKRNLFPMKQPLALFVAIVVLAGSVLAVGQTENVVYRFKGGSDGLEPLGGLTSDNAGNFYGTTCGDGSSNKGTVFQLAPRGRHWTETVLYAFASTNDGSCPFGELIFDQAGNLLRHSYFRNRAFLHSFRTEAARRSGQPVDRERDLHLRGQR